MPGGASGKESAWQYRRHKTCGFDPWVGKIPWRRKWQLTQVFLPGKFHGQRSLAGYSPWSHKGSDMTEHKHKSMEQRKEFRNIYSQLLFDKGVKIIPREKFIFSTNGTSIIEDHTQKCCI